MQATVEPRQHPVVLGKLIFKFSPISEPCSIGLRIDPYFPDDGNRSIFGFLYSIEALPGKEPCIVEVEKGPNYPDPYLNVLEGDNGRYIFSSILNMYEALRKAELDVEDKIMLRDNGLSGLVEMAGSTAANRQRLERMLTIPCLKLVVPNPETFTGARWTVLDYIGRQARSIIA